jgi:hypothetical protein
MTRANLPVSIAFTPDVESVRSAEIAVNQDLAETIQSIARKVFADSGHPNRGVHELSAPPDLGDAR